MQLFLSLFPASCIFFRPLPPPPAPFFHSCSAEGRLGGRRDSSLLGAERVIRYYGASLSRSLLGRIKEPPSPSAAQARKSTRVEIRFEPRRRERPRPRLARFFRFFRFLRGCVLCPGPCFASPRKGDRARASPPRLLAFYCSTIRIKRGLHSAGARAAARGRRRGRRRGRVGIRVEAGGGGQRVIGLWCNAESCLLQLKRG